MLGVSPSSTYELMHEPGFPVLRVGSCMVVPKEKKAEIMAAISRVCGLKTPAHGIVISIPVDEVMGIEQKDTMLTEDEKREAGD